MADAKSGLTHSLVTTAANEHDLNQLSNLLLRRGSTTQPMPVYQGALQREELAEVDVGLLDRRASRQGKTLKQHPRKNKTAINIEYMKASIRAKVEHPFHHQAAVRLREKPDTRGAENDNQLAMLFTWPTCFRWTKMIRQWERSW